MELVLSSDHVVVPGTGGKNRRTHWSGNYGPGRRTGYGRGFRRVPWRSESRDLEMGYIEGATLRGGTLKIREAVFAAACSVHRDCRRRHRGRG